jgi:predicted ester cyclase
VTQKYSNFLHSKVCKRQKKELFLKQYFLNRLKQNKMFEPSRFKAALLLPVLFCFSLNLFAQDCGQHQALIDKMEKAMADKKPELLRDVYHTDAVRHTPQGTAEGVDNIVENAKKFYEDVPDASAENMRIICTDDYVVIHWKGAGTPKGAPNSINVTGITIHHIVDGKVSEEWEEMDGVSLMMQLGYQITPPAMPEGSGDK